MFKLVPISALIAVALLITSPVRGDGDLPAPVQTALDNLHAGASERWAYTRETRDGRGHYVERFDPAAPRESQWQLLAFDGQTPTEEDLERYAERYEELFERESPTSLDFSTLMDPATVELANETDATLEYRFTPLPEGEDDAKILAHLSGTLVIDRERQQVREVRIENTGKIKPMKMVKITKLVMAMTLMPVSADGPVVLASADAETEGRFMGLKKFAESESARFREFEFVDGVTPLSD